MTKPTKPARRPGRPRLDAAADQTAVRVNLTLTAAQRAKLQALGGSEWLRRQIDAATPPSGITP
jgi:hypothetical protein